MVVRVLIARRSVERVASMFAPAAVIAFFFSAWLLLADLGWTHRFGQAGGTFSHWQAWMALALILFGVSSRFRHHRADSSMERF
jgi:hypothetical protein